MCSICVPWPLSGQLVICKWKCDDSHPESNCNSQRRPPHWQRIPGSANAITVMGIGSMVYRRSGDDL
jgi:hypothetical protein